MKKNTLRRILAVIVALCMVLPSTAVWANGSGGVGVSNQEELIAALAAQHPVIQLLNGFVINQSIAINYPVRIDGSSSADHNHTITSVQEHGAAFVISSDVDIVNLNLHYNGEGDVTGIFISSGGSLVAEFLTVERFTNSGIRLMGQSSSTARHPSPTINGHRGAFRLYLNNAKISGNSADIGGGIFANTSLRTSQHIHIVDSEFSNNQSRNEQVNYNDIGVPHGRVSVSYTTHTDRNLVNTWYDGVHRHNITPGALTATVTLRVNGAGTLALGNEMYTTTVATQTNILPGTFDIIATPSAGYRLESLQINGDTTDADSITLLAGDNVTIIATFVREEITETHAQASLQITGNGSITLGNVLSRSTPGTTSDYVPAGTYPLSITPATGHQLQSWSVTINGVQISPMPANVTLAAGDTLEVVATFVQEQITETNAQASLQITGNGSITLGNVLSRSTPGTTSGNVPAGTYPLSITPATGHQLQSWSVAINGVQISPMPANVTLAAGDTLAVVATFAPIVTDPPPVDPPPPGPPVIPPGVGDPAPAPPAPPAPPQEAPPTPPQEAPPTPPQQAAPSPFENMTPASELFDDVAADAWYHGYVTIVAHFGLFQGIEYRIFAPDFNMTRAMFAQVMANLEEADLDAYAQADQIFGDVAQNAWYFPAVQWAYTNGVTLGVGNNNFAPNQPVTREQMAVMMHRYTEIQGIELPINYMQAFADQMDISYWAVSSVGIVQAAGIIQGRPNETFDPQGLALRSEVAAIFSRLLAIIHEVDI